MNLDKYLKVVGYNAPKLSSVYAEYSPLFKDYYKWVTENIVFIENINNDSVFACFKDEALEYNRRIEQKEYCCLDYENIASAEDIDRVEKSFSDGFQDGFGSVKFEPYLTRNIIDNIVYFDPFNNMFFGNGILRVKGFSNKYNRYKLVDEKIAFREGYIEGKRFKSYFLYVEFYDLFNKLPEPFLRQLKHFEDINSYSYIHYAKDKALDLKKVQNIDATDNRLEVRQSADELIVYFKTRLIDWYSDEDIEHFLKANFKCFPDKRKPKLLRSNKENDKGLQSKFYRWVYEFYLMEKKQKGETKMRYAEMLEKNFEIFSNSTLETISKALRFD